MANDSRDRRELTQRRGAVAVVAVERRLLIIRRSRSVTAPRAYCFPGGAMEPGETERDTVCREFAEELGAEVEPVRRLWRSTTAWGVELAWWQAKVLDGQPLVACPDEVESFHWFTLDQMRDLPDLLDSNRGFLDARLRGEFTIDGI